MTTLSRRSLIKTSALLTAATLLVPDSVTAQVTGRVTRGGRGKRPNILFILVDDMGYADLSCYGRTDYQTPAIDGLARQGLRFTQAYANSAVCSATRTALITGRYQTRLPVGLEEPLGARDLGLPPEHPTLPSLLRKQGYSTTLVGKWHLGSLPKYGPQQSGYDHFWGIRGGGVDYFTHKIRGQLDLWDDGNKVEQEGYLTDLLADRALRVIDEQAKSNRPFFLSLHFNAPHWPWEGPNDQAEAQRLDARKDPFAIAHFDGGSMKTYAEMVTHLDRRIGTILARLDELGLTDDTIVVFTSDNGGERFSNTWPLTGRKTELLEGGLRVPAIVRWPGHAPAGSTSDQPIMSMDWLPTLLAAAGGAPDPAYPSDGIDLTPFVANPALQQERTLCWRYKNLDQQACRKGQWKYLKILENSFLFNLAEDPTERGNLKDRFPEKFAELKAAYDAWNATMLPLDPASFSHGFTGAELADHYGAKLQSSVGNAPARAH